jgi:hypothetical protein
MAPLTIGGVQLDNPALSRLVAAALGAVALAWVGIRATSLHARRETELRSATATLATFADWRLKYQPAVAAESIAWRRTWMELQDLGVVGDERLALARTVSRAAEEAGLRDVQVRIGASDTTGAEARLSTEGVRRKPATFSLQILCRGGLPQVVAFLGQLPPSVAATQVSLVRQDGRAKHRITLGVYELIFSNGPPPFWSSSQRRDTSYRAGAGNDG